MGDWEPFPEEHDNVVLSDHAGFEQRKPWSVRIPQAIEKAERWLARHQEGEGTEAVALTIEQAERAIKRRNMQVRVFPEVVIALAEKSVYGKVALAKALWERVIAEDAQSEIERLLPDSSLAQFAALRAFCEKVEPL